MVVDDEVDITTIFKLALEKVNLHLGVYNDPLLALSDYKAGMYDLYLKNMSMVVQVLVLISLEYVLSQHTMNIVVNLRRYFLP